MEGEGKMTSRSQHMGGVLWTKKKNSQKEEEIIKRSKDRDLGKANVLQISSSLLTIAWCRRNQSAQY